MIKNPQYLKPSALALMTAGLFLITTVCMGADEAPATTDAAGLYVKVVLANPVKMSKLKPGDVVEGHLQRDVYSADHKVLTAGSDVKLTVDHLEKRKRERNDHWPWVINVFTPRHENFPVFKTATANQDGAETTFNVSLISVSRMRDVHAKAKKTAPGQQPDDHGAVEVANSKKKASTPTMVLEATGIPGTDTPAEKNESDFDASSIRSEIVPAGTQCKILLLGNVSASKSKPGDVVRARLLEPVLLNSKVVLPAGSLIEGKVLKRTPPRWLSRAGSLNLTFTDVTLPGGNQIPIAASLAGAELDARSHTQIDAEGRLRGERPGAAWMAINIGVTAGISKEVDDGVQLIIEAIVSTATDASTAGTARIVASVASGIYMVTRHGRDVILPRFTEMAISLDRPVSLSTAATTATETTALAAGGK